MRDVTLSDIERLDTSARERDGVLAMDEDAFRAFYEHTSRPVWAYLARLTGSATEADDLLQEAYYRLLRSGAGFETERHRRQYLFRIATNLVLDLRRRRVTRPEVELAADADDVLGAGDDGRQLEQRMFVRGAMARIKPRERALLWLAYAEGASHDEIGAVLGLKSASIRSMLFRARRRFLDVLRGAGSRGGGRAAG
jgi:RNA polymerase sigma-70 factor (ECF subfamily)